jgi:hypothetical protein
VAPRQLIRLRESRRSDLFDDQRTPSEIQQSELVSDTLEAQFTYVLSQIRQILGTTHWHDPVPSTLQGLTTLVAGTNDLDGKCLATDDVGDCVYATGTATAGVYPVTKVDPAQYSPPLAFGIIIDKEDATTCKVRLSGLVAGIYGGMTPGDRMFLAPDGGLTNVVPAPAVGGYMMIQPMGIAVSDDAIAINPSLQVTRKKG